MSDASLAFTSGNGLCCPQCGGTTIVKDSRPRAEGRAIRRRRACESCGHRFSTAEVEYNEHKPLILLPELLARAEIAFAQLQVCIADIKKMGELHLSLDPRAVAEAKREREVI